MLRRVLAGFLFALSCNVAFALYDPKPDDALAAVQGEWRGTLTYRDYSNPDRQVTLPTRLFVALSAPGELVLHFIFDDGPSKTVYSYERMQFDFAAKQLLWASGKEPPKAHKVTSITGEGETRQLVFERDDEHGRARYTLRLAPKEFLLSKDEVASNGESSFRNSFVLARTAG